MIVLIVVIVIEALNVMFLTDQDHVKLYIYVNTKTIYTI